MAKEISRRDFIKGIAAGAVGAAAIGVFQAVDKIGSGSASAGAGASLSGDSGVTASGLTFTPGTYTAAATGMGPITMTAVFSETAITSIEWVRRECMLSSVVSGKTCVLSCSRRTGAESTMRA